MTNFAQITTIGVGGRIQKFVEPTTRVAVIEEVEEADSKHLPLCVMGGGSNLLASDAPFDGIVIRDARRLITVPDEAAPVENGDPTVHVTAEAGCNWDDFVAFVVDRGLEGVEGLSGIPGTVGASVVQNIGAYGQEVASSVTSVEVWDRETKQTIELENSDLEFGYRTSLLKRSMYSAPGVPADKYFPSPRYIVLSVTFLLRHEATGVVEFDQLAKALGVQTGDTMPLEEIRGAVLRIRASKGMLEDATRYRIPAMQATKRHDQIDIALREQHAMRHEHEDEEEFRIDQIEQSFGAVNEDYNRHSCGSFFINPQLTAEEAAQLPEDAPRYDVRLADGSMGVKTSAAWLIDHAGFHKGYRVSDDARAALSDLHTLAITNRGGASADDIATLARAIQDGVQKKYGIKLVPEPVIIGLNLD